MLSVRTRLNYVLDIIIGLAFLLSAASGVVFLVAGSGGYQGGRNAAFETAILGISRWTWSDLHAWTSLVMISGVMLHFVLHWRWVVCATKGLLRPRRREQDVSCQMVS